MTVIHHWLVDTCSLIFKRKWMLPIDIWIFCADNMVKKCEFEYILQPVLMVTKSNGARELAHHEVDGGWKYLSLYTHPIFVFIHYMKENKTSRTKYDTPTKNQFIGAVEGGKSVHEANSRARCVSVSEHVPRYFLWPRVSCSHPTFQIKKYICTFYIGIHSLKYFRSIYHSCCKVRIQFVNCKTRCLPCLDAY